jgi:hypothetical protein
VDVRVRVQGKQGQPVAQVRLLVCSRLKQGLNIPANRSLTYMQAEEFDRKFDEGEDVSQHLDISKARRPVQDQKRVNVDFPLWMIRLLDKEAKRLGVPRRSIIKLRVAECLKKAS